MSSRLSWPRWPSLAAICAIASLVAGCGTSDGATGYADPELGGADADPDASARPPQGNRTRSGPSPDAAVLDPHDDASSAAPAAITFVLVDAAVTSDPAGKPVTGYDPIAEGARIDLGFVGRKVSVLAVPRSGTVGSVRFTLDGAATHVEEAAPYSLCGDDGKGVFTACALLDGKHTLVAETFGAGDLDGGLRTAATLDFTILGASADGG